MQTESVESGFLSIFALITFFIFLITNKYSHKINNGILLDKDFYNLPKWVIIIFKWVFFLFRFSKFFDFFQFIFSVNFYWQSKYFIN